MSNNYYENLITLRESNYRIDRIKHNIVFGRISVEKANAELTKVRYDLNDVDPKCVGMFLAKLSTVSRCLWWRMGVYPFDAFYTLYRFFTNNETNE